MRPLPADSSRVLVSHAADGELPGVGGRAPGRALGRQPVLPRGGHPRPDRARRARAPATAAGSSRSASTSWPSRPPSRGRCRRGSTGSTARPREVLSLAAVIGRTFGLPLLERLVARDELMQALTELQRLDLIVEKRRRPNPEYRFRHGLVQEVAYASLVDSKRRKLHKRVGEALEEIYKESPEEAYGLLARHFTEADEPEKAVDYLLKAGDAARAVYADQGGARALPQGARLPGPARRRAPGARHALQDGARLPPRLRLRERRGDVRRGVLVPRRRGPAPAGHRAAGDRVGPPERAAPRRGLHDRGRLLRRAALPRAS